MELLLCSKNRRCVPPSWVRSGTRITAEVELEGVAYRIAAMPAQEEALTLGVTVTDPAGADVTAQYLYRMSHYKEQDAVESFDGQNRALPLRLFRYRNSEGGVCFATEGEDWTRTKAFRAYLLRYIKTFTPERINNAKDYLLTINRQGQFQVFRPGYSGKLNLSETERKLFLYTCFLNIAEFWREIEMVRDLHHEKKPLLIKNFLEYLDASTNVAGLVQRTRRLQRQVFILSSPLDDEAKKAWTEDWHQET